MPDIHHAPSPVVESGDLAEIEELMRRDTEANTEQCRKRIAARGTVLFAGAGCSMPNYPNWTGLLVRLEDVCIALGDGFVPDPVAREASLIDYADTLKSHIARTAQGIERYEAEIYRVFRKEPDVTPFHRELVALPFRAFVTTNYDNTLQAALAGVPEDQVLSDKTVVVATCPPPRRHEFLRSLSSTDAGRYVAHLHGYYQQTGTIVLGRQDYQRVYGTGDAAGSSTELGDFLDTVMAVCTFLFVGFGFRDDYIDTFLRYNAKRFVSYGTDTHFAIMATTRAKRAEDWDHARRLRQEHGIATIFYDNEKGDHAGLHAVIRSMLLTIRPASELDRRNALTRDGMLE